MSLEKKIRQKSSKFGPGFQESAPSIFVMRKTCCTRLREI